MKVQNLNLNLVRIIAAWMVLSVHIARNLGIDFSVGATGVSLFFILSGYLAFCSLGNNNLTPKEYYKKRAVRILPTYWLCLVLVYCNDIVFGLLGGASLKELFAGQCGPRFLRYFLGLQCILPSDNWDLWNNHSALWTMSSFMAFYLIAPWLYRVLKKFSTGAIVTIAFLFGRGYIASAIQLCLSGYPASAQIEWFSYNNPLSQLHCFLLGITVYLAIKEGKQHIIAFLVMIALIVTHLNWYAYELLFMLLIFAAVQMPPLFQSPEIHKLVSFISGGSFALYLIHPLVLGATPFILRGFEPISRLQKVACVLFYYVLCIGVSYAIYYFVIAKVEKFVTQKVYGK